MGDWLEMAVDSLDAAKQLKEQGRVRSSLSRAYYSAYSAVTGELLKAAKDSPLGPGGRQNPAHEQVVKMAKHNLDRSRFSDTQRHEISRALRDLRRLRVAADYDPDSALDESDAVEGLRRASRVNQVLGGAR